MAKALTPEMVAERWQCSATHVRALYRQGKLRGFRVGERLIRFSPEAVEEFECQTGISSSDASRDSGSLPGSKTDSAAAIASFRALMGASPGARQKTP